MKTLSPAGIPDYRLLDTGRGLKLESWAGYLLTRPDPNAVWEPRLPESAWRRSHAVFQKAAHQGAKNWIVRTPVPTPWLFRHQGLRLELQLTPFKHTGVFPEQAANWDWCAALIKGAKRQPSVLNLFGYTGAATLAAAAAGAKVCHVDASKPAITWANHNQKLTGLADAPVRWILDDCLKFVKREQARGARYDAVIMDPPSFGRDPQGKVFKFEDDVPRLLRLCKDILSERPLFFLINGYAMGYSATVLKNMLGEILPVDRIECGELQLKEENAPRCLPCSVFARYPAD
ncbi:MAG TPA: class I SAM-dependent methyltransferase [Candidatus Edwardsbacteria bacterium]|nr:class I SAM-dependent methyltransferase [Candidatus Edwardsbacteria bacterium]